MLDEQDIKKLSEVLVSKSEFNERVDRLEENVSHIRRTTDALLEAMDKVIQSIDELRHEYIAIKLQLDRHEKWIKEIAEKTGVTLSL